MLRNVIQSIEALDPRDLPENLAERRRALRIKTYCHVEVSVEGQNYKGIVTDMGLEGMRLKSQTAPLVVGLEVNLRCQQPMGVGELGVVRCQVLWVQRVGREFVAGLRYADTRDNMKRSWVRHLLQELGFDDSRTFQRRRHMRVDGFIPARIFFGEESLLPDPRVINLGIGGALVESRHETPAEQDVELEISLWRILPTLCLPARIIEVRQEPGNGIYLHCLQFGDLTPEQIRLLGNYIINFINQSSI
jgi:hypothetical protein